MHEVSSVTIRAEAEKYAKEQVESQKEQFRELGIMTTWEKGLTYRTMGTRFTPLNDETG